MLQTLHAKRGLVALAASAMMLLSTLVPLGAVTAAETGKTDGLVVVAHPRGATTLANGDVAVGAVANAYVFDVALFTATGQPFAVTEYMVDVHTIDGRAGEMDAKYPSLVWTTRATTAAASELVVRVPASEVVWYAPEDVDGYHHELPFGGLAFTVVAVRDADGNLLRDPQVEGDQYAAGSFSLLANELAAQGKWPQADQADEAPTPLLLFNGQHTGLVQPGNPLLNAGFEFGTNDQDASADGKDGSMAIPPWIMVSDAGAPVTAHHVEGAAGASGSAAQILYDPADNDKGLHFGQLFFVPGAAQSAAWKGTDSVKVEFDVRARDEAGLMSSFHALGTLHWADAASSTGESQHTTGPANGVPTDDEWRHVVLDFGARASGAELTSFFFSFNLQAPQGSRLVVTIDNVVVSGARVGGAVQHQHDVNDGFATFVLPADLSLSGASASQGAAAVQRLTQLNGEQAYVFRLAAMDYTGIGPKRVDLPSEAYAVFQLLDEDFVASHAQGCSIGCGDVADRPFHAVTNGANAGAFYRHMDASGQRADEYVVVVPASLAGDVVVPHLFVDVATGDTYQDAFGSSSEPASGYHSFARNAMQFTALADAMDYHFTPVLLSSQVGGSLVAPATVTLDCPLMTESVPCSADPAPDLTVAVASGSRVQETLTVELVSPALGVLASAPLATPGGGSVAFTVTEAQMDAMREAGLVEVFARVTGGLFTSDAASGLLELENLRPVADFSTPDLAAILSGATVAFASTSTDTDGSIATHEWRVDLIEDATDDASDVPLGLRLSGTSSAFSYAVEDDGLYAVTLTVTDDGGATATKVVEFAAANSAPTATIVGPAFAGVGQPVSFTYRFADADGAVGAHTVDVDGTIEQRSLVAPIVATFLAGGVATIRVEGLDDDGALAVATLEVLVDDVAPTTDLLLPTAPARGWFSGPVDVTIQRADLGGAGVRETTVTIDGLVERFAGSGDVTLALEKDGETTITAVTADRAGNAHEVLTRTVRIDVGAPTATVASARALEGAPVEDVVFADAAYAFSIAATDAASGVAAVELYVDGGEAIQTMTEPGADGLYTFSWTAAGTGVHTLWARVVDAVGHETTTEQVTILVI